MPTGTGSATGCGRCGCGLRRRHETGDTRHEKAPLVSPVSCLRQEERMTRPSRPPSPPKPQPIPVSILSDRVLVGAFAALVAARPLVAGDDPGRLRLTSSAGPVSFTLLLLVVLVGFAVWRLAFGRGRPARWP